MVGFGFGFGLVQPFKRANIGYQDFWDKSLWLFLGFQYIQGMGKLRKIEISIKVLEDIFPISMLIFGNYFFCQNLFYIVTYVKMPQGGHSEPIQAGTQPNYKYTYILNTALNNKIIIIKLGQSQTTDVSFSHQIEVIR